MRWKQIETNDKGIRVPKRWLHIHYYEALNILFRFENSLRVFVYVILKNALGEAWSDASLPGSDGRSPGTIRSVAARRISMAENFGYLGYDVRSPLMHMNAGELVELITSDAYWEYFSGYFRAKKDVLRNKLLEILTIRNSLAHFRPIKSDDIAVIKQNCSHTLLAVEECLSNVFAQSRRVPTNTSTEWYLGLSTLGSEQIVTTLFHSSDEQWVNVKLSFSPEPLSVARWADDFYGYQLIKISPPAILLHLDSIRAHCTYVSERVLYPTVEDGAAMRVTKEVNFVFRSNALAANCRELAADFKRLLSDVSQECELLSRDALARGTYVEAVAASIFHLTDSAGVATWRPQIDALEVPYKVTDPDEFWGKDLYVTDVVSGSTRYPWMSEDISQVEGWMD